MSSVALGEFFQVWENNPWWRHQGLSQFKLWDYEFIGERWTFTGQGELTIKMLLSCITENVASTIVSEYLLL